jgi:isopropylmalate/homocitrate/citramalate synthase
LSNNQPWLNGLKKDWFISHFNLMDKNQPNFPKKIYFYDTTLRDGEQQPGIVFGPNEKVKIAKTLDEVGIDYIEPALPAVSIQDQEATRQIASMKLKAKIVPFSRCMASDVRLAAELGCDGITAELPTSPHLLQNAYGWTIERAIQLASDATKLAKELGLTVTFFCIDATRSSVDFLKRILHATEKYADYFCIADSFGVATPESIAYLVRTIKSYVDKPLQIHCHNMFGLGTANTIAGLAAGAEVAHATVGGIGEGAGNTPLEEVLMVLRVLYDMDLPQIKFDKLYALGQLVEKLSKVKIPPQKAIIGANSPCTFESGIPVAWIRKLAPIGKLFEAIPYSPEIVGHPGIRVVLGKKSGLPSIITKMEELGLEIPSDNALLRDVLDDVKRTSLEKRGPINEETFKNILKKRGLIK